MKVRYILLILIAAFVGLTILNAMNWALYMVGRLVSAGLFFAIIIVGLWGVYRLARRRDW